MSSFGLAQTAESAAPAAVVDSADARIVPLDGWRFISVALVIAGHLLTASSVAIKLDTAWGRFIVSPMLYEAGALGVTVFFVISGFVIMRGLMHEHQRFGRVSLYGFYIRRVFRILPPLVLYGGAIVILASLGIIDRSAFGIVKSITFACNFIDCGGWFGAHTWSLSYEEQFYLIIPVLFAAFWISHRRFFAVLPCLVVLLMACTLPVTKSVSMYFGYWVAISTGVAWAVCKDAFEKACRKAPTWSPAVSLLLLAIALRLGSTQLWPVSTVMTALLIVHLLIASTFISDRWAAALSSPPIAFIGRISYSIYLWQQLATYRFVGADWLFYLLSVSLCVVWSALSYTVIEKPMMRYGRIAAQRWRHA